MSPQRPTSPSPSPGPSPGPKEAMMMKDIAQEIASAAATPGFLKHRTGKGQSTQAKTTAAVARAGSSVGTAEKKKRKAPPPPIDLPASVNLSSTATIDKKVGEKILIFEKKIKNAETPAAAAAAAAATAPKRPELDVYDDVELTKDDGDNIYDDTVAPEDDYYTDAMTTPSEVSSRTTNGPDDLPDDTYDDTVDPDAIYDDTINDEAPIYQDIPYDDPQNQVSRSPSKVTRSPSKVSRNPSKVSRSASKVSQSNGQALHNGARPKDIPSSPPRPGKLPRTPFDDQSSTSSSEKPTKEAKMRRYSKKSGKRITIPSGEYQEIPDSAATATEPTTPSTASVRARSESAAVREALGAFDDIFTDTAGKFMSQFSLRVRRAHITYL